MANLDYVADLVRREDRDRFITAMFMPADRRADVMALMAFNVEVARIRESVSETLVGRMKLQWWRDVVEGIYAGRGAPQGNPVTEALATVIMARKLPRADFDALLATRARDLESDERGFTHSAVTDLEDYAEGTSAKLLNLTLHALGAADDATLAAARHVGIAYGLTGILRAVLFHARDQKIFLPQTLMNDAGLIGVQDLQAGRSAAAIAKIVRDIAVIADAHLGKARSQAVTSGAVPALLLGTIADRYLHILARANYDVTDSRVVHARPNVLPLMWNAWRGTF
ncbi:MAG: phytoene/squalene synthase family protein [Rhodospirillaceae bacterium]|nr:phytoene/squalene synthase family protein [Rhodospirillaceae bacterium]